MDLILKPYLFVKDGIFGDLLSANDYSIVCVTLQHAYLNEMKESYEPKLQIGTYTCVRGMHQLEGMTKPFETFEITNVPGHTNILFHVGNFNRDSSGCVLLGQKIETGPDSILMITHSAETFARFMQLQADVSSFILTVF